MSVATSRHFNSLLQEISSVNQDTKWRLEAQERMNQPLNWLLHRALSGDPRYHARFGLFHRFHRASGQLTDAHFDLHVTLDLPPDAVTGVVELMPGEGDWRRGMVVRVRWKGRPQPHWSCFDLNRIRGILVGKAEANSPLQLVVDDERVGRVLIDVTPAALVGPGFYGLGPVVASIRNTASWPHDEKVREQLVRRLVLLPVNDLSIFAISPMLINEYLYQLLEVI